jgi:hypothetical protein
MYVETVVQVNDRDTYKATVRLRSAMLSNRPPVDAYVRLFPPGWVTMKSLAVGAPISVVSATEVLDITNLERVQSGDDE